MISLYRPGSQRLSKEFSLKDLKGSFPTSVAQNIVKLDFSRVDLFDFYVVDLSLRQTPIDLLAHCLKAAPRSPFITWVGRRSCRSSGD